MKTGFVYLPESKKWALFKYSDGELTIYNKNKIESSHFIKVPLVEFQSSYKYIVGIELETSKTIIFFISSLPNGTIWSSESTEVYFFFILDDDNNYFNSISFHCRELDYFYDSLNAINLIYEEESDEFFIKPKDYNQVIKQFNFAYQNIEIKGSINILSHYKYHSTTPLEMTTYIKLTFSDTNNIEFIIDLYNIVYKFICFIAQRKNIKFDNIKLYQKHFDIRTNEQYSKSIVLEVCEDDNNKIIENEKVLEKTIPYSLIKKHLSSIWNFIAENKLYLEHIPENSLTNTYNIARMILIVAAFEWNVREFGKSLDISISKKKLDVKNNIIEKMESLSTSYNSKQKSYLNSYIKQIEMYDISLSNKINNVIRKYENILLPFIKKIYNQNNEPVTKDYRNKMSERIEKHRNAFAHGNIKMEIDDNIILDLHILQWAIYCIILDEMGFQEDEMKSFINYTWNGNVYIAQGLINKDKD